MMELTTQTLLHMLEHGDQDESAVLARAMVASALSWFWSRRGEDFTVAMLREDIETVRSLATAMPEECRPIGAALH